MILLITSLVITFRIIFFGYPGTAEALTVTAIGLVLLLAYLYRNRRVWL